MRCEVKDRCAAMVMPIFVTMGSPLEISQLVETELTNYNYIYPSVPSMRIISKFYDLSNFLSEQWSTDGAAPISERPDY